jgi:ABC-type branched-subunit amino acid transport system substrate-binding protein
MLTVVVVAGVASTETLAPQWWRLARVSCWASWYPTPSVWSSAGECVGVSDGSYRFGLSSSFDEVFKKIAGQNNAVKNNPCGKGAEPVTVGVFVTLTSPTVGGRAQHELDGFAAAQANANSLASNPRCAHPIQLRIAQIDENEKAAVDVAQLLADSPDIVAVVGMGPSTTQAALAVQTLANWGVPVVADRITAEGFDQNGSKDDNPDFSNCNKDDRNVYDSGIGRGFFRVTYRVATQAGALSKYLNKNTDFIITPNSSDDPFTCTTLPLLRKEFGLRVPVPHFDPKDTTTVQPAVQQLCRAEHDVTAIYAARAQDLSRFLTQLDDQYQHGVCTPTSITVASVDDASRILVPEPDAALEALRMRALAALGPKIDNTTKLKLVYTGIAPEIFDNKLLQNGPKFKHIDPDDDWAINAYNALTTVEYAVNGGNVTRGAISTAIGSFSDDHPVLSAAQEHLTFDNNGNRKGDPAVVRICPATGQSPHPATVEVYPTPTPTPTPFSFPSPMSCQ